MKSLGRTRAVFPLRGTEEVQLDAAIEGRGQSVGGWRVPLTIGGWDEKKFPLSGAKRFCKDLRRRKEGESGFARVYEPSDGRPFLEEGQSRM